MVNTNFYIHASSLLILLGCLFFSWWIKHFLIRQKRFLAYDSVTFWYFATWKNDKGYSPPPLLYEGLELEKQCFGSAKALLRIRIQDFILMRIRIRISNSRFCILIQGLFWPKIKIYWTFLKIRVSLAHFRVLICKTKEHLLKCYKMGLRQQKKKFYSYFVRAAESGSGICISNQIRFRIQGGHFNADPDQNTD